jgi:hypothetical protein
MYNEIETIVFRGTVVSAEEQYACWSGTNAINAANVDK